MVVQKPEITEIVLLALPFLSLPRNEREAAIILKQKAGIYGQVINEVARKPNCALIFCNPGLAFNPKQMQRVSAYAKRVLGERLLIGPSSDSITTFFSQVDYSSVSLASRINVLAYGEHGGPRDCVNSWGKVFRTFLERKGLRVKSVTQPPEYIIRVGDDNSLQAWKKRAKKLKKEFPSLRRRRKGVIR